MCTKRLHHNRALGSRLGGNYSQ